MKLDLRPGTELILNGTPKPGIYLDVPDEIYFSQKAVSKSDLKMVMKSPQTYKAYKDGKIPRVETKAFNFGHAFHLYCLQNQQFSKIYGRPLTREMVERDGIKLMDEREKIQEMVDDLNGTREREMSAGGVVMDTETLVAMLDELNKTRQPKINSTGTKPILTERILNNQPDETWTEENLAALKGPALKDIVDQLNSAREGLLSTSGSRADLVQRLRDNGAEFVCRWELLEDYETKNERPYLLGSGNSRDNMITWLNAEKYKGGKWATWAQVMELWQKNNPDKTMLSTEIFTALMGMRDSLMANDTASKLLWPEKGHHAEVVIVWVDPATGLLCRAKLDSLRWNGWPLDLKSVENAGEEGFSRSVQNYAYDWQEAHYLNGLEVLTGHRAAHMPFVCVEKEPPYLTNVWLLSESFKEIGRGQVADALQILKDAMDSGTWKGYGDEAKTLEPQGYYLNKNMQYLSEGN